MKTRFFVQLTFIIGIALALLLVPSGNPITAAQSGSLPSGLSKINPDQLQATAPPLWAKTYQASTNNRGGVVVPTSDGGFLVGGKTTTSAGCCLPWLFKVDVTGNLLWQQTYSISANSNGGFTAPSNDGGVIALGTDGTGVIWILKADAQGGTVWSQTYQFNSNLTTNSIVSTSDGGYLIAGTLSGSVNSAFLFKIDSIGNLVWQKTYTSGMGLSAYSSTPDTNGGYVIVGNFNSYAWLAGLDATGKIVWQKNYAYTPIGWQIKSITNRARGIVNAPDGSFIVTGETEWFDTYGFWYNLAWVMRVDATGNILWQKYICSYWNCMSDDPDDRLNAIIDTGDGNFLLVGDTIDAFPFSEAYLIKIDASGKVLSGVEYTMDALRNNFGAYAAVTEDGGLVFVGSTDSGTKVMSVLVAKTDSTGYLSGGCNDVWSGGPSLEDMEGTETDGAATAGDVTNSSASSNNPSTDGTNAQVSSICVGTASYNVSGYVYDSDRNPVPGVTITDGVGDSALTDSDGYFVLTGLLAGTYTITPSKNGYSFSPLSLTESVPPSVSTPNFIATALPSTVTDAINHLASDSNNRIDEILQEGLHSAQDSDYFATQKSADEVKLIAEGMVDTVGTLAEGFKSVKDLQDMAKVEIPGVGSNWSHIIHLRDAYEPARDAFRESLFQPLTAQNAGIAAKELLNGSHIYYAADLADTTAEKLTTDNLIVGGLQAGLQQNNALQTLVYPGQARLADIFKQDMTNTDTTTLSNLPPLTPDQQAAYIDDLNKRDHANLVMTFTLEQRALLLHSARAARENNKDDEITKFLEKWSLKGAAFLLADGPGVIAVDATDALTNLYLNARTVDEDHTMLLLGAETEAGALDTQRKIYLNTINGMENIVNGVQPTIANGTIASITNKSVGEYCLFIQLYWCERASYSEVNLTNTTSSDTTFQVIGNYGHTGLFGLTFQPLVGEDAANIAANQSGTLPVRYKQSGQGDSPDDNSTIEMDILGSTATGTYYVTHTSTLWQPTLITTGGQPAQKSVRIKGASDVVSTIPYPIRSRVDFAPDSVNYVPNLLVDNPFTETVHVVVSQDLPTGIQVIDANGGTISGQSISWSSDISPQNTMEITYTVKYSGQAGTTLTLPAAHLQVSDQLNSSTFTSDPSSFQTETPLVGTGIPPMQLSMNQEVMVPITITNRTPIAISGTVQITLTDFSGAQVYIKSQNVNVPSFGAVPIMMALTAPTEEGTFIQQAIVNSNGGTSEIYTAYLEVSGCSTKPAKPVLLKPKNGSQVKRMQVLLDWADTPCASTYTIIVREGSKQGQKVQTQRDLTVSRFKTQTLTSGKTYVWKVKAVGSYGSNGSAWWSFKLP